MQGLKIREFIHKVLSGFSFESAVALCYPLQMGVFVIDYSPHTQSLSPASYFLGFSFLPLAFRFSSLALGGCG